MNPDVRASFPVDEVASAVGARPAEWAPVASAGYGVVNAHWRARMGDGRRVFVKHALTSEAAGWLRKERIVYEAVRGPFMPAYFGAWDSAGTTLLVLEDLGEADWPPPWSPSGIESVLASLRALHATPPPAGLDSLEAMRQSLDGWPLVASGPEPLLATRLCSRAWLEEALPALAEASAAAELGGDELLHLDVRSDNLCLLAGRAVLVDWNLACRGNGRFDVAFWLPSLRLEGGPEPAHVLPNAGALSALVAGYFAARAGLPAPPGAPTVREFQRAQAAVALAWAADELGLKGAD
ncbi:MAG: aminoglycoside phosphotransferase family protein [Thermoleophilia bacterium]|nr:aminoglycoside phosphotransferase family protein [Thermoleophilia bacterium]